MNILKYATKTIVMAGIAVTLAAAPSFATIQQCVSSDSKYANLSTEGGEGTDFPVRCQQVMDTDLEKYVTLYAKTAADCANAGTIASDPDTACEKYLAQEETNPDEIVGTEDLDEGEEAAEEEPTEEEKEKEANTQGPAETKKDDSSSTLMIAIIAGVVALIAIVVVVLLVVKKHGKKNTPAATPEAPVAPTESSANTTPLETIAPVAPEAPVEPEAPATPETPVEPEAPAAPETPAESETPAEPEAPATPAEPEATEEKPKDDNPFSTAA